MSDEPEIHSFRIDFREVVADAIDADPGDLEVIRSSLSDDGESASVHVIEQDGGLWTPPGTHGEFIEAFREYVQDLQEADDGPLPLHPEAREKVIEDEESE